MPHRYPIRDHRTLTELGDLFAAPLLDRNVVTSGRIGIDR